MTDEQHDPARLAAAIERAERVRQEQHGLTARDMILRTLRNSRGAKATPRNIAVWLGLPLDEVRAVLGDLERDGLAEALQTYPRSEHFWVITDAGKL